VGSMYDRWVRFRKASSKMSDIVFELISTGRPFTENDRQNLGRIQNEYSYADLEVQVELDAISSPPKKGGTRG